MINGKASKILALGIAMTMLASTMIGCGKKEPTQTEGKQSQSQTTAAGTTAGGEEVKADRDPYEFTFYSNYDWADTSNIWGNDKISTILKEKFNITVNSAKPEGDPVMKLNVMVASDDLPDAIMMERDPNYFKLINLGKLVELDSYIEKYPGYKSVVQPGTINLSRVNDKVYGMLNWATSDKHPTGNGGWAVNKKIYEQLGSPKLETTDDLYNYLKLVKDSNVTVDGKTVLPIQFASNLYLSKVADYSFGQMSAEGVVPVGDELKLYYTTPAFKSAMLYMNKLWRENLINKDYFVEKSEQIEEKLSNGRVAVYAGDDISSNLKRFRDRLIEKEPDNDYLVIAPIAGGGIPQKDIMNSTYQTLGWNVICISNKAQKPERIFEFFDYIISDEGALLTIYGPKGEMYDELDENGYPILTKTDSQLTEDERNAIGIWNWTLIGNTLFTDISKVAADNRKPVEDRDWTVQAQSNIIWKHSKNADAFVNLTPDPQSDEGIIFAGFEDMNKMIIPKIITTESEEACLKAIEEAISSAYDKGFEKVEQYKTELYRKNLELLK